MLLSTSSSRLRLRVWLLFLLGGCTLICVALELGASTLLRHGLTRQRFDRQRQEVARFNKPAASSGARVLLVGNSLLADNVDEPMLLLLGRPELDVRPLFLEATAYYDWYYALRRLLRSGIAPEVIAIGIGSAGLIQSGVRPDYSPRLLFGLSDVLEISRDVGLDRTATSNLALATVSDFWGHRGVIRAQVFGGLFPGAGSLIQSLARTRRHTEPGDAEIVARHRLRRLRALCEEGGSRLVVVLSPTRDADPLLPIMSSAGQAESVDVLVPIRPGTIAPHHFPDGVHLDREAAIWFTDALVRSLKLTLRRGATAKGIRLSEFTAGDGSRFTPWMVRRRSKLSQGAADDKPGAVLQ